MATRRLDSDAAPDNPGQRHWLTYRLPALLLATLGCALATLVGSAQQTVTPAAYQSLPFRYIGLPGNRVNAVAGVAGDPNIIYAGTPSGGIFKSTDAGLKWQPVFDDQIVASIGALAVARSDAERGVGGHRRPQYPAEYRDRQRRLQVHRRRQDLGAHGARPDGPDRPRRDRPAQSVDRVRGGDGALLRSTAGARRVPHARRRQDLGACALRRREHRRHRRRHRPGQPAQRLCRHVAAGDLPVVQRGWRPGQRPARLARRRHHVDAAHRPRSAEWAARPQRDRHLAEQPEADLRGDRERRTGQSLAIGGWRRELVGREPRSDAQPSRALLLAPRRLARQPGRGLFPTQAVYQSFDAGKTTRRGWRCFPIRTTSGSTR